MSNLLLKSNLQLYCYKTTQFENITNYYKWLGLSNKNRKVTVSAYFNGELATRKLLYIRVDTVVPQEVKKNEEDRKTK